jgi:hypothetical protein
MVGKRLTSWKALTWRGGKDGSFGEINRNGRNDRNEAQRNAVVDAWAYDVTQGGSEGQVHFTTFAGPLN